MNIIFDGDAHAKELKHAFEMKYGKYWYYMRSVVLDLEHLFARPGQFARVRLNPFVNIAWEWLEGRDSRGKLVDTWGKVRDTAEMAEPIPFQGLWRPEIGLWHGLMGSMGLGNRRAEELSDIHELAASYMKKAGIVNPVEIQTSARGNPYYAARLALEDNDLPRFLEAAAAELDQLRLRKVESPALSFESAFKRYYLGNFTGGNKATEHAFYQSLTPGDKAVYDRAKKQGIEMYKNFKNIFATAIQNGTLNVAPAAPPAPPAKQ